MTKKNMYKKSDRTFVNPYNFVSIDRKKIKQENIEETYKDKEELHTGYLDCVLVLFIDDETKYAFVFKSRCRKKRNL